MIIAIIWVLSAFTVAKLDAVMTGERTDISGIFTALFIWPLGALYLITCKHHINNSGQNDWDY